MDRGAWRATVHGVTKSWARMKRLSMHTVSFYSNWKAELSHSCVCVCVCEYLIIWVHQVFAEAHGLLDLHSGLRDLLVVAGELLVARGICFPDQGSNPGPLHWECGVSGTRTPRKSSLYSFEMVSHTFPVHFSSATEPCPTLCGPTDCSMPGLPVHHQLPEPTQTHVHWVSDAIQPSHPLSSPSPPTFNLSQHQGLFKWVSSSHQVAKILEFQLQHQSFQWICRTDFLSDGLVGSPCCPRDSQDPKQSIASMQSLSSYQWYFSQN